MKNQKQIKIFVSVFLALLSVQGTAMTGAAAMVSTPDPTEQTKEAVTEVLPEEYAPADFLSISGNDAIPNIIQGTPLAINGTVKSDFSKITVLTAGVYDATGKQVLGKTLSPNQVEFNLQSLNDDLPFETLQAGTYHYRVTASNATHQDFTVIDQNFVVSGNSAVQAGVSEDAITIKNSATIPNITVGTSVSIYGVVYSASSNITTITVGIYDSNHKMITGKNAYPTATSFNVKRLDDFVDFSELQAGTYTYEITVTNGTYVDYKVVNQKFTVSDGSTATTDTLSISGGTTIPNIKVGNVVSIRGTVASASSNLKSVTVGVYDSNNKLVTGKTVTPNAKTYNIRNLDAYVSFGDLSVGTYFYKIIATNATHTNYVVVNQKFTVSDGSTATTDTLSISGGTTIPNIKVGNVVSIRGTVTSASSNLKSVTVGVYDSNNKLVTGKTVTPNAKTYNIRNLDAYVSFGSLKAGTYSYKVIATNATHTNVAVVNQKFTVSDGSTATTDTLHITGGTSVPNITEGTSVVVKGIVSSAASNITSVTVGVYSASGNLITGKTVRPNAKTYDLRRLDAYVNFNLLTPGSYLYRVTVTNGTTSQHLVNQAFQVKAKSGSSQSQDKLTLSGGTTIPNIKVGNVVSIRGTVASASSNLKSVTVGVYDSNNKLVTGKTATPNAKTYNVRNLDAYVSFGDLKAGTYYYKVIASNAANTNVAVVNQKFTVSDGSTTTTDKLSMTGGVTIPNIKVGNVVSIRGTVTSASSNLKSVTVGVYDSNNKLVTGKTATPNAKTYNVRNLDAYVSFGDLKAGTYYYRVFATNATTTNFPVVEQKFTVSANGSTTASDTLSISGGTSVPNITEGTSVVVKGTVSSASSNITSVTVGVYSASGNLITGKTAKPNAKSYDLRKLDAYVNFNLLTPGSYLYRVTVSNGTKTQQLVNQAFQVKAKGGSSQSQDRLTLSGGRTIPNIKVGKAVSIRGTVKSGTSNITSLTVGVFTSSGNLVTGKTVRPNAKSYDIHQVDAYVNFNLLSPDTYYYGVIATNGSHQNQIVSYQKFTVTK